MALETGWILLLTIALFAAVVRRSSWYRKTSYPPGPKPRFFLGNTFDIPTDKSWETYGRWSKECNSTIIHATALDKHLVILNSPEDAVELLEKRAQIYSSRPRVPMLEVLDWAEFNSVGLPYGPLWRAHRRLFQQLFRLGTVAQYRPIQTNKTRDALRNLLSTPTEFAAHLKTLSSAVIMSIMYDYDVSLSGDHFVDLVEKAVYESSQAALPGSHAINSFPFLRYVPRWLPGGGFHKVADRCRKLTHEMRTAPYEMVRRDMEKGNYSSVLGRLLAENDAQGGSKERERVISDVTVMTYAAGSDTTAAAFLSFVLAMAIYPDVQRKAREEILALTGGERLPVHEDRDSLPYLEAVYRELLRWRPVVPLGVPHSSTEDDYYKGYFIPKGSIVMANVWTMTRDESVYPDPENFLPERFLDEHGNLTENDRILVYGFGRSTTKAKDEAGNEIPIQRDYTSGIVSHPPPFECSITPLSEGARQLVEQTA
ncbi:cytochrome P450 [Pluteus cervinus]|uniref:Cytochrome P450 n=1 Tax=Pluteus cervinus TaxID=181527 RepID=A0ACD3B984_9AGAR|nr:cytochrome P450 [Pluteus cervinus]